MIWTLAMLLPALADVAPPSGHKLAKFEIAVESAPEGGDQALVVYPWSLSNGVPLAQVGEVRPSANLRFGRRIEGAPAFWMVPRESVKDLPRMKETELRALFDGGAAMKCGGDTPKPVFQVPVTAPDTLVERFTLELDPGRACTVRRTSSPETGGRSVPAADGERGCATVGAMGWAGSLWLLVALGIRRRRF